MKGGKKQIQKLEARIREMEAELDSQTKATADGVKSKLWLFNHDREQVFFVLKLLRISGQKSLSTN